MMCERFTYVLNKCNFCGISGRTASLIVATVQFIFTACVLLRLLDTGLYFWEFFRIAGFSLINLVMPVVLAAGVNGVGLSYVRLWLSWEALYTLYLILELILFQPSTSTNSEQWTHSLHSGLNWTLLALHSIFIIIVSIFYPNIVLENIRSQENIKSLQAESQKGESNATAPTQTQRVVLTTLV